MKSRFVRRIFLSLLCATLYSMVPVAYATRVADYLIIADEKFEISHWNDPKGGFHHEVDFDMANDSRTTSSAILMFVAFANEDTKNVKFVVNINGQEQLNYTLNGNSVKTLHEVINPNILQPGKNTIEFHPVSGDGKLHFGDVVLIYKREI